MKWETTEEVGETVGNIWRTPKGNVKWAGILGAHQWNGEIGVIVTYLQDDPGLENSGWTPALEKLTEKAFNQYNGL